VSEYKIIKEELVIATDDQEFAEKHLRSLRKQHPNDVFKLKEV